MRAKVPVWLGLILLLLFTCWGVSDCLKLPAEELERETRLYQGRVKYGEPLGWEEVNKLFPKFTTALLTDLETGKQFEVERRGGTFHADIQPVTKGDTAVLKEIYGGAWSWRRRAVVAEIGMSRLAASINGMPHGAGKLNNNFPGHFCIHFLESRVHLSKKVDPAHQMMIWKAAGYPERPFAKAEPEEVINLVLTALNQEDVGLALFGLSCSSGEDIWLVTEALQGRLPSLTLKSLNMIKEAKEGKKEKEGKKAKDVKEIGEGEKAKGRKEAAGTEDEVRIYEVALTLQYPKERAKQERKGQLTVVKHLVRTSEQGERWRIEGEGLITLLQQEQPAS